MRFDYINSFADSAENVIKGFIPDVRRGPVNLAKSMTVSGVSATVFLIGHAEGRVALDLETELAKKVAGAMNGMVFERLDHLAMDTICELSNIIIGKAITTLNNKGFKFKTSPPCFFVGEEEKQDPCHGDGGEGRGPYSGRGLRGPEAQPRKHRAAAGDGELREGEVHNRSGEAPGQDNPSP